MIRLYENPGWGSAIVELQLAFYDMPYELVSAGGVTNPADVKRAMTGVNPLAQVPALVLPSGEVMTETAAMTLYLADLTGSDALVPAGTTPLFWCPRVVQHGSPGGDRLGMPIVWRSRDHPRLGTFPVRPPTRRTRSGAQFVAWGGRAVTYTVHATRKLADRIQTVQVRAVAATGRLGNWYATLMAGRWSCTRG